MLSFSNLPEVIDKASLVVGTVNEDVKSGASYNDASSFVKTGQQNTFDLIKGGEKIVGNVADKGLDTLEQIGTSLTLPLLLLSGVALVFLSRK